MKKLFAISLLMSSLIFACGGESETVVTDEGKVTSTLGVIMNEWDVKPTPNYKMGKAYPSRRYRCDINQCRSIGTQYDCS